MPISRRTQHPYLKSRQSLFLMSKDGKGFPIHETHRMISNSCSNFSCLPPSILRMWRANQQDRVHLCESMKTNKLVMDKIQSIEGVGRTETHIAIE